MVYLDYNATTPVDERVLQAMLPFYTQYYANPASRAYAQGSYVAKSVEIARENIARTIGCIAQEIVFTSGATESINLAIKGLFDVYGKTKNHIITVATEHKAVLSIVQSLEQKGATITILPVDKNGLLDIAMLEHAIRANTLLIAVMYANNETGVCQDIASIGRLAKEKNIFFCCDATQAVGKKKIDVQVDNIDLMAFSGHKLYAPKGIGVLYVRRKNPRVYLQSLIDGGGQERNIRSGTLNVPAIIGLSKALDLFTEEENSRICRLNKLLEEGLGAISGISLQAVDVQRIGNVSSATFKGVNAKKMMTMLASKIAVSTGAACGFTQNDCSHVLRAMGLSHEACQSTIRFSLGRWTTEEDIYMTIDWVNEVYKKIKNG